MKSEDCTSTIATPVGRPADALTEWGRRIPSPADLFGALWRTLLRWQRRHEDRLHLAAMDDRLLRDIGISREQADAEARKPFWRA